MLSGACPQSFLLEVLIFIAIIKSSLIHSNFIGNIFFNTWQGSTIELMTRLWEMHLLALVMLLMVRVIEHLYCINSWYVHNCNWMKSLFFLLVALLVPMDMTSNERIHWAFFADDSNVHLHVFIRAASPNMFLLLLQNFVMSNSSLFYGFKPSLEVHIE